MLDEPFAGIDPVTVQGIQEVIRNLSESGISILITDHAAREILQLTDRTYVVSDGRILCSGTTDEIIRHEEVKRKYLGEIDFFDTRSATAGADLARQPSTNERMPGTVSDAFVKAPRSEELPADSPGDSASEPGETETRVTGPQPTGPARTHVPELRVKRPRLPVTDNEPDKIVAPFRASDLDE